MEEKEKSVFRQLVDEHLAKHEEDWYKASGEILRVLNKDKKLLEEALPEIMYCAVRNIVQRVGAAPRSDYWRLEDQDAAVLAAQEQGRLCKKGEETRPSPYLRRSFANPEQKWMEYLVKNGKKLGDYTGAEMRDEADYFEKLAKSYAWRAGLFREIASRMPASGTKRIREVLSERQVAKMAEAQVNEKQTAAA